MLADLLFAVLLLAVPIGTVMVLAYISDGPTGLHTTCHTNREVCR